MFGMNEKVGRAYFNDMDGDQLKVTSRFYTLQGEGPFRGMPAYFIRLAKCNLSCSFCDTYFDHGEDMSSKQIFDQIEIDLREFYELRATVRPDWTRPAPFANHADKAKIVIVITGGEPTLQTNLIPFLNEANKYYFHTQIESNGILFLDLPKETTYVVSPKCAEKDGSSVRYFSPNSDVLKRADCLKFVMSAPENEQFSPYSTVPQWALDWQHDYGREIFVSPMNIYNNEPKKAKEMRQSNKQITIEDRSTTDEIISFWEPDLLDMDANQRNHEYAAEYCMKYGLTLNLQTHLFASLP
tara:strand:+ start:1213 stop:2106 length:894 start_codon:yes stop_codon:yes gene_type:complete